MHQTPSPILLLRVGLLLLKRHDIAEPRTSEFSPWLLSHPSPPTPLAHRLTISPLQSLADNADAHKIYSAQFLTEGAACVVPLGTFTTHAAIEGFRAQAWVGVPKRLHTPIAIFASPTGDLWGSGPADGVMIHGEVSFWPESGGENLGNPWAARMNFAKDGEGNIKLRRLQVFMTPKQK